MSEKKSDKKKNRKNTGLALALWLVAAIVLFIIFLVNWNKIVSNLKSTGFFNKVFGSTPEFVQNHEVEEQKPIEENDVEPMSSVELTMGNINGTSESTLNLTGNQSSSGAQSSQSGITGQNDTARNLAQNGGGAQENQNTQDSQNSQKGQEKPASSDSAKQESASRETSKNTSAQEEPKKPAVVEAPKTMNIKLSFMEISSNGSVIRREVTRTMPKSDSPLVDSINALIAGPNQSEEKSGCRTLVSNGTRLIGASVKNGVATLNFSAEFEFNQYGIEGTRGQLQQIVYTATAFPTVDCVQFLVEGEKRDYLGSEGVWIGSPLTRDDFY